MQQNVSIITNDSRLSYLNNVIAIASVARNVFRTPKDVRFSILPNWLHSGSPASTVPRHFDNELVRVAIQLANVLPIKLLAAAKPTQHITTTTRLGQDFADGFQFCTVQFQSY
jgi:hypothetical protein